MNRERKMWRTAKMCADCPFASRGPGLRLRKSLARGRWKEICDSLMRQEHFHCHKTTDETGDGSKLICAGSIEWQDRHGTSANLVRIMERIDYFFHK
jgi:hypothetical protein